ncbi:MAG TPA: trehalase family glycosidase [Actinomycetota bacterium]|nr:trehalase family glycosidase [Actinomycetota bacterium]
MGAEPLPAGRAWNTWDPERPGCMIHLLTGFVCRVTAYSASLGRFTDFPFDPNSARLGRHRTDGSYAELELTHAGSRLRLCFATEGPDTLVGHIQVLETGEWGLRFWYSLEVGFWRAEFPGEFSLSIPVGERRYVDPPVAVGHLPARVVVFGSAVRPFSADLCSDPKIAGEDLEHWGYYYRPPANERGRWAVFRFNAMIPRVGFAACLAPLKEAALRSLRVALPRVEEIVEKGQPRSTGTWRPQAIRDVVGWNTIWDSTNERAYTASTRAWVNRRFGGWVVWQIDAFFHVLLAAHVGDWDIARANLAAALSCRTEDGNLAALMTALTQWIDRAHPPIGALVTWILYQHTGDRTILEESYPILARAFDWWFRARDGNKNGILEYGSSPVGDGHFVHTKLAAMDESASDNSPIHDAATFREDSHTLDMEDVGLNSLLVNEGGFLARAAEEIGTHAEAERLRERAETLAERVRTELWDPERRIFANRLWDGRFAPSLAPTSFYAMLAGLATPEQAETMVREHLVDPTRFGGPYPVAGTPHDDPASIDNVYWRGRVWPCFNYLVYRGLRRYRFDEAATDLAKKSAATFEREWTDRRSYENFNQRTGQGGDSVDADPFYTWGALLPMLADLEVLDLDPWDGLSFGCESSEQGSAELQTRDGLYRVEVDRARTRLFLGGREVLSADLRGRFRKIRLDPDRLSMEIPPAPRGGEIEISARLDSARATLDGHPQELEASRWPTDKTLVLRVPPSVEGRQLTVEPA